MLRFGTDGVRGVALTELTPDYVTSLGAAAARVLGGGTWLIGRDPRQSGPELEVALVRGLRSEGATVVRCGVVPTPALAHWSGVQHAPAAMITASHNPYADNGVKIFAAGGLKLRDEIERDIEAQLERHLASAPIDRGARPDDTAADDTAPEQDVLAEYIAHVAALFPAGMLAGLRVVLDCANGAMSDAAPAVARALGADAIVINASPNGTNINAECGATHPSAVAGAIIEHGADVGLAFDGDGDRVIAVDHRVASSMVTA